MILRLALLFSITVASQFAQAELSADITFEHSRVFGGDEPFQSRLLLDPKWSDNFLDSWSFSLKPHLRGATPDEQNNRWDMSEAYLMYSGEWIELQAGSTKVFWGVTESFHLVDVINQFDYYV